MLKSDLQPAADEEEQVLVYLLASIVYSHAILDSNSCLIFPSPWSIVIVDEPGVLPVFHFILKLQHQTNEQSNKQLIIILFHFVFFDLGLYSCAIKVKW